MADTKLSDLTPLGAAPDPADTLYLEDALTSKQMSVANLFTSPTLVTPALGTPASGVATNLTGTAAGLTAGDFSGGKQTMWVPAAAMRPTVSNGCAPIIDVELSSANPNLQVLDFDDTVDEHAQFQVAFPKKWNESTVTYEVFWTATATSGDVIWALQGVSIADDAAIDVVYGTAVTLTDTATATADELYRTSESSAITISGTPAEDELCFFKLYRDANAGGDTMTGDARLIGIKLFYTTNTGNDA